MSKRRELERGVSFARRIYIYVQVGVRLKYTRMWPFPPEKKKNVLLVGKPG